MSLESRLFRHLRKFVFEQDEAEVRAIIRREVRQRLFVESNWRSPSRSADHYYRMLEGARPEITGVWVDEAQDIPDDTLAALKPGAFVRITGEELHAVTRGGRTVEQILAERGPETTGYAVPVDEKRPAITTGNWDELWARAEAEDAAKDKK